MGTKNNPGTFDCYENADPDEEMFVLLARDKSAPLLVRLWADLRLMSNPEEDADKILEAMKCADNMVKWRNENR